MARRSTRLRRTALVTGLAIGTASASVLSALPAAAATTVAFERGVLTVSGDANRDSLTIGRTVDGGLTLNGSPLGAAISVNTVDVIRLEGGAADDTLRLDERNGVLPRADIVGGDGNDQLTGGSANDSLFGGDGVDSLNGGGGADTLVGDDGNDKVVGGAGDDFVLLGDDSDQFTWNPGDGSDFVNGDAGKDTLLFTGSAANEVFNLSSDGARLRLARNVGGVTMSVAGFELVALNSTSGQDVVQIGDLTGAGTNLLQVTHAPPVGADAGFDSVTVTGTSGLDRIRLFGEPSGRVTVGGLPTTVQITGAEGLDVRGLAGDDVIDGARLGGGVVALGASGGDGNDTLVGTSGNDTLRGDDGDDRLEGRGGTDVLDGGRGDNVIIR